MIFLDFVLDPEREILWLAPIERSLQKIGKLDQLSVLIALGGIYLMSRLADEDEVTTVLLAGIAGLVTYLAVNGLDGLFEESMEAREEAGELDAAPEDRQDDHGGVQERASSPSSTSRSSTRRSPSTASSAPSPSPTRSS